MPSDKGVGGEEGGSAHRGGNDGGDNELEFEGVLDLADHTGGADVGGHKCGEEADQDAHGGDHEGVAHGHVQVVPAHF